MKRKLTFGTITLSLALLLAACGNDGDTGGSASVEESQASVAVEESAVSTEETSEEASVVEESVPTQESEAVSQEPAPATTGENPGPGIEGMSFAVDMNQAVSIFHETFEDDSIPITNIDFDDDFGDYEYEIDGWKDGREYLLTIKADGSGVTDQEIDNEDDDDEDVIPLADVISPEEAMEIALVNSSGGYVDGWELQMDDGRPVYEVDIEGGRDVDVHAITGEVIEID